MTARLDPFTAKVRLQSAIFIPLLAFLISRLALLLIGLIARDQILTPGDYVWIYHDWDWLDIWGVWDTGWFLSILTDGYMSSVSSNPGTPLQANWAFFPLYPMLGAAVSGLTGLSPFASLLVVSNLCFIAALIWIRQETEQLYGAKPANWTVLLLCVIPGSHIFSSAYSEASFLLFVVGTLAMARKGHWLAAGCWAALAVLTRNFGILLLAPMAVYFLQQEIAPSTTMAGRATNLLKVYKSKRLPSFIVAVLLPCLALIGFMTFLYFRTGDFLAFLTIQMAWGRNADWPFLALFNPFFNITQFPLSLWPSVMAGWVAAGLCFALVWKRQWAHAVFSTIGLTILLTAGILSVFRLVLPIAPLWMMAGNLLAAWPRIGFALLPVAVAAEACLMWGWAKGWPVY